MKKCIFNFIAESCCNFGQYGTARLYFPAALPLFLQSRYSNVDDSERVRLAVGEVMSVNNSRTEAHIVVGTRFGNCVFFEDTKNRRTGLADDEAEIRVVVPPIMRAMNIIPEMTVEELLRLATRKKNIGLMIENIISAARTPVSMHFEEFKPEEIEAARKALAKMPTKAS